MDGPSTPLADKYLRGRYGLPDDFDLDSVPFHQLEIIGAELRRGAEVKQREAEARQKAEAARQPPKIVPQLITSAQYLQGERYLRGVASTGAINSHGQVLHPGGADIVLPVPLLLGHDPRKCIGSVEQARIDEQGAISICANIDRRCDAPTWRKIQRGELGCLSGAADPKTCSAPLNFHGVDHYFSWRLREVSLCESGANHQCIVTAVWPPSSEAQPSEEPALTSRADLAQSVGELVETLRLPVKPIYDKSGKLIGAQRADKAFEQFEARLAAVESRPAALYRGVWAAGEGYETGELVTDKGCLWACREATRSRPGENQTWRLAVKRGRA